MYDIVYDIIIDPFVIGFIEIPVLTILLCGIANWRLENTRLVAGICFLVCSFPVIGNIGFLILTILYTIIGLCSALAAVRIKKALLKRKVGTPNKVK
ncbi:hypothetical protein [Desulfoscipio sp. XC116]|uniref:hypothetical protein n=1 Tax=Desulfoscipio sp. XC116 TaxID=3144975 RepID=UPI00325BB8E6